jgi:AraC-like DNA-binding protein
MDEIISYFKDQLVPKSVLFESKDFPKRLKTYQTKSWVNLLCWYLDGKKHLYLSFETPEDHKFHVSMAPVFPLAGSNFHRNNYVELTYLVKGSFDKIVDGKTVHLNEGDAFYPNEETYNSEYVRDQETLIMFLSIDNSFFASPYYSCGENRQIAILQKIFASGNYSYCRFVKKNAKTNVFANMMKEIFFLKTNPDEKNNDICLELMSKLFIALISEYDIRFAKKENEAYSKMIFTDLTFYLQTNLKEASEKKASEDYMYSTGYLTRLCKKYAHMSFTKYVQKLRLTRIAQELLETDRSILEIAEEFGYTNMSFFYKIFKAEFGMLPKEYRLKKPAGN